MIIKQISVFLQNQPGRLEMLTDTLYKHNINISALSIAENEEYGVMRMILSDPEKAENVLKAEDFSVKTVDVISMQAPDVPGALHKTLQELAGAKINVAYMYGYSSEGTARLIIKVSDPERASVLLSEK